MKTKAKLLCGSLAFASGLVLASENYEEARVAYERGALHVLRAAAQGGCAPPGAAVRLRPHRRDRGTPAPALIPA